MATPRIATLKKRILRVGYSLIGQLPVPVKRKLISAVSARFMVGLIGIVRDTDSRLLVLEHTYRPSFPHGLPSGVLKRREPVEHAIPREVKEETGFDVRFLRIIAVLTGEKPRRLDFWIECEFVGGEFRQSPEVRSAQFLTLDEAKRVLPPAQSSFIEGHLGLTHNP